MAEKKKTKSAPKPTKAKKTAKKIELKKAKVVKAEELTAPLPAQAAVPKKVIAPKPKKEKPPKGLKYYGTGRRKEAIAKVWLKPGTGKIILNGKGFSEYFCGRKLLEYQVMRPLTVANAQGNYDVYVEAYGGGIHGQAGAVSLGIARALLKVNPDFRVKLKREGLLTRDPRMKERKKYGLKGARRAFQYTKR